VGTETETVGRPQNGRLGLKIRKSMTMMEFVTEQMRFSPCSLEERTMLTIKILLKAATQKKAI
jgi:hypothetical protein